MASRKQRKRYRRKLAEATAGVSPTMQRRKLLGGWGRGVPSRRSDWRLVGMAANRDWPTPQAVRGAVVSDLMADFDAAGIDGNTRRSLTLAWVTIAMEGANIRAEQRERAELLRYPTGPR